MGVMDSRPEAIAQRELADAVHNSPYMAAERKFRDVIDNSPYVAAQRQRLPDGLKSGIEAISSVSLDGVIVHYNSSQPARLNALAYTRGTDIHLAPGEERHLPHEAWHVVQQAQGRVRPTINDGVPVNDDAGLEREADVMGKKASQMRPPAEDATSPAARGATTRQREPIEARIPLQLKREKAIDYEIWAMYKEEILATETADPITFMLRPMACPYGGVFLTDKEYECESTEADAGMGKQDPRQYLKLTLPDKHNFELGQSTRDNELTLEQNCQIIAEHELVHVKHTWENLERYNEPSAKTYVPAFNDQNFEATCRALYSLLPTEGNDNWRPWLYIEGRLEYMRTRRRKDVLINNEVPAVIRELHRYMDLYLGKEKKSYTKLYDAIIKYDQLCSAAVNKGPKAIQGTVGSYNPFGFPETTVDEGQQEKVFWGSGDQQRLAKVEHEAQRLKQQEAQRLKRLRPESLHSLDIGAEETYATDTGKKRSFNPFQPYKVKENCNLRNINRETIRVLTKGEVIYILDSDKAGKTFDLGWFWSSKKEHYWVYIKDGTEGWVRKDAIDIIEEI